ncbi:hypothetical protein QFZ23_003646 [Arthrobacter globiformis]|uniref:S8 family serine peptidase n=1 Tax=Arthrobacter globiformis TaxID=1665 RepID=UPI002782111C|nr:S8 family serine peptidase [Arthrobacter globiformis]MDQ1059745.1 hypothetical protein [Arthrobacter globiformis]
MDEDFVLLEGGVKVAEMMLSKYDREEREWTIPQGGEFWEAVRSARMLDRFGEGCRIAIIDGGFDASYPAIADQHLQFPTREDQPTAHGTVVALLVHEIAPRADLDLYPCAIGGKLEVRLVEEAITQCIADGVGVINLSLGKGISLAKAWRDTDVDSPTPDISDIDDWRRLFNIPDSPVGPAVRAALQSGVTVIASAGNHNDYVYIPAAMPGVAAVGFQIVQREIVDRVEIAESTPPSFLQSLGSDYLLEQPANVLGSSFACPLIAGFASLMKERELLSQYLRCARRSANASAAMAWLRSPTVKDLDFVRSLFRDALESAPHSHHKETIDDVSPCPECALFAAPAYIDFGLFLTETGDLGFAEQLLKTVRGFAPTNYHAAANLGITFACKAEAAKESNDMGRTRDYLHLAIDNMRDAVTLRPNYAPYMTRLNEFSRAEEDPMLWSLAP